MHCPKDYPPPKTKALALTRSKEAFLAPTTYMMMQYSAPITTCTVDTNQGCKGGEAERRAGAVSIVSAASPFSSETLMRCKVSGALRYRVARCCPLLITLAAPQPLQRKYAQAASEGAPNQEKAKPGRGAHVGEEVEDDLVLQVERNVQRVPAGARSKGEQCGKIVRCTRHQLHSLRPGPDRSQFGVSAEKLRLLLILPLLLMLLLPPCRLFVRRSRPQLPLIPATSCPLACR